MLLEARPSRDHHDTNDDDEMGDDTDNEPPSKRSCLDGIAYLTGLAVVAHVPATYTKAIKSSEHGKWATAIAAELAAHERNHTWKLVKRELGMKVIGNKWVFALKKNAAGAIVR